MARSEGALSGNVEVDGAYFGGYVKPANEKKDRKDRRKKINQSGKRQSVIVMRERKSRTLTYVTRTEAEGVALVALTSSTAQQCMLTKRRIGTSWRHIFQ